MVHPHRCRRSSLRSLDCEALVELSDGCCLRSLLRLGGLVDQLLFEGQSALPSAPLDPEILRELPFCARRGTGPLFGNTGSTAGVVPGALVDEQKFLQHVTHVAGLLGESRQSQCSGGHVGLDLFVTLTQIREGLDPTVFVCRSMREVRPPAGFPVEVTSLAIRRTRPAESAGGAGVLTPPAARAGRLRAASLRHPFPHCHHHRCLRHQSR
jgi:hypothetical protein